MTPNDGFITMLEGRLQRIETDIHDIKKDIHSLTKWKVQVMTLASITSLVLSLIFKLFWN